MLNINLGDIVAINELRGFGGAVNFRIHLRAGSIIELDKIRALKVLEAWKQYCVEYPTHDPKVILTV